tara:strand:- start:67362 stop:68756 length:1395 start_codon:yes stop_codon:yes gene_type:complete
MVIYNLNKFLVGPNNNLKEVMKKIDLNGHGIALIVDDDQKLLGLITDGDIRRAIIQGHSVDIPINIIMNRNPISIRTNYNLETINRLIEGKLIDRLPVLDDNNVVCELLLRDDLQNIKLNTSSLFTKNKNNKENRKILVIGGAGFIGSVLTKQLLDKGYSVRILDKLFFGNEFLGNLEENDNFSIINGDISHIETIIEAIKDVDAVVHLAEIVGDPACAINPEKTQQINYLSVSLVTSICKHFQLNRFIYASSCSVYGVNKNNELLHENSPLNPVSLYARMKIESEKFILNMADNLFCPTILRLATVFGESPRMRFDLVINTLTVKAIKEGKITIFGGDQWRPNVHVGDVARAIIAVLEAPIEKVNKQIFNVGSEKNNYTIKQIGDQVKEVIPSTELVIEKKDIDQRDYEVDFAKIKSVLGFQPLMSVTDGIKEIASSLNKGNYKDYKEAKYYNNLQYKNHFKK